LTGADFGLLLEGLTRERFDEVMARLAHSLSGLYGTFEIESADVGHVGAVYYSGQDATALLSEADMALRSAQAEGANHWAVYGRADEGLTDSGLAPSAAGPRGHSAGEWNAIIEAALDADGFVLERQPVIATGDSRQLLHEEIFLRLPDPDRGGGLLAAGRFLPMAENAGLAPAVDRWVVARVLRQLGEDPTHRLAVNLSHCSLRDPEMLDWLRTTLGSHPGSAPYLILELPEYGALAQRETIKEWIEQLAPLGVEFSLDHFGQGFSSFAYLRNLKAHYLKLDGSFVRHLEEHSDHQFFLQAVAEIAHGLDMRVIAESVETEAVWQLLPGLGIDGGRGYWLGEPN
jgi:EAL domain-containing protein (putative c-di-GMP-specific phosphodiesterase class I)